MYPQYLTALLAKIKTSKVIQKRMTIGALCILVALGVFYWLYSNRYVSTDDAYINANIAQIAAQVTGPVATLNVTNNQFVQQNQLLFVIDPAPFQIAVNKAKAELDKANVALRLATYTSARIETLVQKKVLPQQSHDDAIAQLQSAAAQQKLALANLAQAELDLQHTHVLAPISGWVSNMSLYNGSVVIADQLLFALISNNEFWVDANFKETELKHICPGQRVKVVLDMYTDHVFNGIVASISGGSGAVFSLLPPENATGNWVKITQRIPVKIHILASDINANAKYPLRIGATANVTVDTASFFH